jgi:hypothetical protein
MACFAHTNLKLSVVYQLTDCFRESLGIASWNDETGDTVIHVLWQAPSVRTDDREPNQLGLQHSIAKPFRDSCVDKYVAAPQLLLNFRWGKWAN